MAKTPLGGGASPVTFPDQPITDPVALYLERERAFNADQLPGDEYTKAFEALVQWEPATAQDFLRKFVALFISTFGEGDPLDTIARQGKRLLGEG